jgi:protein gp37
MEMGKTSYASYDFSPWWGCAPVSDGCKNCYAQVQANRFGTPWGFGKPRKIASDARWADVKKWNKMSAFKATSDRVFCGSMCDVFEARPDLVAPRQRLFQLIQDNQALVFMLLTKRIGNAAQLVPWKPGEWPDNVWLGTTVENQPMATQRIPALVRAGAKVTFISGEPLLEQVDWDPYLKCRSDRRAPWADGKKLLILGCESGPRARPCDLAWVRSGVAQAQEAGVPVFVKQLWIDGGLEREVEAFPADLQVRQMLERPNP